MIYNKVVQAIFLERPNRFLAICRLLELEPDRIVTCHVKNTGRLRELLEPEKTKVYLTDHGEETTRKTRFSLIAVEKGKRIINIDSQAPNQVVKEWLPESGLFHPIHLLKAERKFGESRFDFYIETDEKKIFMEVKGVTLDQNGIARFPDAPTLRGVKHIRELMKAVTEGYEAYLLFVVQMEQIKWIEPNNAQQKEFGDTLRLAADKGVRILGMDCKVGSDFIKINQPLEVHLS